MQKFEKKVYVLGTEKSNVFLTTTKKNGSAINTPIFGTLANARIYPNGSSARVAVKRYGVPTLRVIELDANYSVAPTKQKSLPLGTNRDSLIEQIIDQRVQEALENLLK